jgi:hypothetical protein
MSASPELAYGRIPVVVRIGVTGHRDVEDRNAVRDRVRRALGRIRETTSSSTSSPTFVIVSSLAEGTDRLVVQEALGMGNVGLEASLPLPADEYSCDFASDGSKRDFERLLSVSSTVWVAGRTTSRAEAYELAGHRVVDRSDVMIAVWDGAPSRGRGGTADIVTYARSRDVPILWIRPDGTVNADEWPNERQTQIRVALENLTKYNSVPLPPARFQSHLERRRNRWEVDAVHLDDRVPRRASAADWILPFYCRADLLAIRYQRRFNQLGSGVFVMAAVAVTTIALQATFFPKHTRIVAIEVGLLLCLLAAQWIGRRWRVHERWISYRFLAERIRSMYFLALAGTVSRDQPGAPRQFLSDPSDAWIERAISAIRDLRPEGLEPDESEVSVIRQYLSRHWIEDELRYHGRAARSHAARDRLSIYLSSALFFITLVAALLHVMGFGTGDGQESRIGETLVWVSIAVPAWGAAAHGIATQREYRRQSDRYARTERLLENLHTRMSEATSIDQVRALAVEAERVMREENSDWFGVMRFHDIELVT